MKNYKMKLFSYFDGKTRFSQIFLGCIFFIHLFFYLFIFFLGGVGGANHRVFHLWPDRDKTKSDMIGKIGLKERDHHRWCFFFLGVVLH